MLTAPPTQGELIPPTETVRIELARCAREHRRLRSLLKLAQQAEEDRRFVAGLLEHGPGKMHAMMVSGVAS